MASCGECNSRIDRSDNTKMECFMCRKIFHAICVNMLPEDVEYFKREKKLWKCFGCVNLRKSMPFTSPPLSPCILDSNLTEKVNNNNSDNERNDLSFEINDDSDIISKKILSVSKSLEDTKNLLLFKFKEIEENLQSTINELRKENKILKCEIKSLCNRVDYLEQVPLNNSIDIIGLPNVKNDDDLRNSVLDLCCRTLKSDIKDENIESLFQKVIVDKKSDPVKNINIIRVKFKSSDCKDIVMKAKNILKDNPLSILNEKNEKIDVDCYINHSMTFNKRKIYKIANDIKKEFKVQYLWFKNGNILMRKRDGAEIKVINNVNDLDYFKV